jgi:outer membrane protein TolC
MIAPRTARSLARRIWRATVVPGLVLIAQAGCQGLPTVTPAARSTASTVTSASQAADKLTSAKCGDTGATASATGVQNGQNRPADPAGQPIVQTSLSESKGSPPCCATGQPGQPYLIDLGTALRLAGVDNPTIDLARERVQESLADQLAARALLVPSVNLGGNYRLHTGALQQSQGDIIKPTSQDLYLGAGAFAIGSGTVALPGVWLFAHLGDALYEPIAARQLVAARRSDARAVQYSVLLQVATAYLELDGARARLEILHQGDSDVSEIVRVTQAFAEAGQGTLADANRATANAELVRGQIREAEGEGTRAAARLCQLVAVDPSVQFRTPDGLVVPIRLVPENTDLEELVSVAIRSRPELLAQSAAIQEAQTRVRQERMRPWLPLLAVGYSEGAFGAGSSLVAYDLSSFKGRSDFDVLAVWTLQNLGAGNRARVKRTDAVVGEAIAGYDTAMNQVRREVAEAQAAAKAAAEQIDVAKPALAAAEQGFKLEIERIKLGQGLPIETLDSFQQLLEARLELARATVAFDVAQFQLFVAIGNDPESGLRPEAGVGSNLIRLPACPAAP